MQAYWDFQIDFFGILLGLFYYFYYYSCHALHRHVLKTERRKYNDEKLPLCSIRYTAKIQIA